MTIRFVAAPGQNAAGLIAGAHAERLFVVVVEPKLWCGATRRVRFEWPADEPTLVLRLYEGDVAVVQFPDATGTDPRRMAVEAALGHESMPQESSPGADDDAGRSDFRLLAELPVRGHPGEPMAADAAPFTGILGLLRRAEACGRSADARYDVRATTGLRPLRPLLHLTLVEAIEAQLHDIRRGYVPVTASVGAVRGRLLSDGLVRHIACRETRLSCRFDELTDAVPLYRILVTALRCIAIEGRPGAPFGHERAFQHLGARSSVLLQQLSAVRPLARVEALRALSCLRLTRFERRWQRALDLAGLVLRADELAPQPSAAERSTAFSLEIVTPTFWEAVLRAALETLGSDHVVRLSQSAATSHQPWAGLGGTSRPDIMLGVDGRLWCIDAKYKRLGPGGQPSKADQYQLFAYSHLARHPEHAEPDVCVLAYPCHDAPRRSRHVRNPAAAALSLFILHLPFPSPAQVQSPAGWRAYLETCGQEFRALAEQVGALHSAA